MDAPRPRRQLPHDFCLQQRIRSTQLGFGGFGTATLPNRQPNLDDVIRLSQQFPAAERLLLAKALLDGLVGETVQRSANGPLPEGATMDEDAAVAREREAFLALHPTLLLQYPNEYVAIHQFRGSGTKDFVEEINHGGRKV